MTSQQSQTDRHWQQELLHNLEVGIVVLDRDFTVEVWNRFMENNSDVLSEQICGASLFKHFSDIDENWLRAKVEPVFNLGTPVFLIWEQRPYLFRFSSNRPITSASDHMYQNVTIFPVGGDDGGIDKVCLMVYNVTDQALSKLRVDKLNKELETMSRIDGLTGLYNRRYWQERFDEAYKLAKRRGQSVCVMMLDIDHFKAVNDTYGHQAGDKVIQHLAKVIQDTVRETDLAGRYGGEEFAIVLPDSDEDESFRVAERIRTSVMQAKVEHEGQVITFTASFGISRFKEDCGSAMAWLERADQALYEAKLAGRNRAVICGREGETASK